MNATNIRPAICTDRISIIDSSVSRNFNIMYLVYHIKPHLSSTFSLPRRYKVKLILVFFYIFRREYTL